MKKDDKLMDKEKLMEELEKERQFAIKIQEPYMALGIARAMEIVRTFGED